MLILIARRVALSVITLTLVSVLVFVATEFLPGDAATQILGRYATPEATAALREQLGLNAGGVSRYFNWVGGLLTGDLGMSTSQQVPVTEVIGDRLRNTMLLAGVTALIGVPLALGLGVWAGLRRGKLADRIISTAALIGTSLPEFVIGALLVMVLAIRFPLFPSVTAVTESASPAELLPYIWLPIITLTTVMSAYIVRTVRSSVIDSASSEFVEFATIKGNSRRRVVMRHLLPSALIPSVNVVGLMIAWLVGGVVIVEQVFNYPGIGTLTVSAVQQRDLPMIQALGLLGATAFVVINLTADVLLVLLNPKLRRPRS